MKIGDRLYVILIILIDFYFENIFLKWQKLSNAQILQFSLNNAFILIIFLVIISKKVCHRSPNI